MNEMPKPLRERKRLPSVAAAFLVIFLFSPQFSDFGPDVTSFLSFSVCGAATAWILTVSGPLAALLTALPVLLVTLLSQGPLVFLPCCLLYLLYGFSFHLVNRDKLSRAAAAALSATVTTAVMVAAFTLQVYLNQGTVSIDAFETEYADFFLLLREMLKKSFTISIAGNDVSYISDANIQQYVNLVVALMPGLLGLFSTVAAFLAGWFFKLLLRITHREPPPVHRWKLAPAPMTTAFLCLSLAVTAFAGKLQYPWLAAVTFLMFLLPEYVMSGFTSTFEIRIVDGLPRPRILRGILLFIGMLNGLPGLLIATTAFSIFDSIRSALPRKHNES